MTLKKPLVKTNFRKFAQFTKFTKICRLRKFLVLQHLSLSRIRPHGICKRFRACYNTACILETTTKKKGMLSWTFSNSPRQYDGNRIWVSYFVVLLFVPSCWCTCIFLHQNALEQLPWSFMIIEIETQTGWSSEPTNVTSCFGRQLVFVQVVLS